MSFFDKWRGVLRLPSLPKRKQSIGGNWVVQSPFLEMDTRARIAQSQEDEGHDLVTTELPPPFEKMLLRRNGARRISTQYPVLMSREIKRLDPIPESFELRWDSLGDLATFGDTPEEVLQTWKQVFEFRTEEAASNFPGLRTPQIAALHAIAAHFSVGEEFEAATVVLPTGTGKTETMLAAQVYLRLPKVLVLVPSLALRAQISEKFMTLGVLPKAKVIPPVVARPHVAIISKGIRSLDDARKLAGGANVIVALPQSLEASSADALDYLSEVCTDLFVDEAHHVTAATWASMRDRFKAKRIIQFTATPFRRDRKRVDGRIIFNYKLGDAQKAGYYKPINLLAVEEYGASDKRDQVIAKRALDALRRDRNQLGLDHLLMARTDNKSRANEVAQVYAALAPDIKSVVVYSGAGRSQENRRALTSLKDRGPNGARIVICVDMLGEGYDLPNLKIAALHDNHKSLAVTLQFIGRFTRQGDEGKVGEATVVTNVADPQAEEKLTELYAEGADWDRIIRRLSEDRIQKEITLQNLVEKLKVSGDLHIQLSLWNLSPSFSSQFFRTQCDAWDPLKYKSILKKADESWHAFSETEQLLVAVICRPDTVSWGDYKNLHDTTYHLLILKWDQAAGVLCIHATDYNALMSEKIAKVVAGGDAELVRGVPIFNVLNNVEMPLVKSLGSSRIGAISFTSYFGPNVTDGLASIEKAESELNNLACLGYEDGHKVLWGCAQRRGKVWQVKSGSIADWIEWSARTWKKVCSETAAESNITRDFLRPAKLDKPHTSIPIALVWGELAQMRFNSRQSVFFGSREVPVLEVDLEVGDVQEDNSILMRIVSEEEASEYRLIIDGELSGGYEHRHVSGPMMKFKHGNEEAVPLEEYLQKDPFIVRYVDGTYSYNCYHIVTNLSAGTYDRARLESWDWSGIPLNAESMHKARNAATIQYRTFEKLRADYDLVFNDDGCGEAADLVCLKDIDDQKILLCLVHCKGAHDGRVSQDIRNFYTVCGQAQKSIVTKHAGLPTLYHDLRRRQETWVKAGADRFLKGNMKLLAYFKEKSRRAELRFELIIVQPGASIREVTDDALRLLATTELYLSKTTEAKFRVVLSE